MVRRINRLSARTLAGDLRPGRHADGNGLYLVVDKRGSRRWVFMSWTGGRQIELGLGGASSVSLKQARELAADYRRLIASGRDPRDARNASRAVPTFREFAEEVVASLEVGFRNAKHRAQWRSTLERYAGPIASKRVDSIITEDVLACLKPIWVSKNETASRVRGRIERVLDAAKARGYRSGENPARWRGHLDHLLPKRIKLQRGHHPAMPWREVPEFMGRLREREAVAALALEFTILTAARSGEVLGATWDEFDLDVGIWTVPAVRMKPGRDHRVPLSDRATEILATMETSVSVYVFPGQKKATPISNMGMAMLLRRMGVTDATVHGFRSSFRDWAGDATTFSGDLAEAALSHVAGDQTERAYRRGDALEKRRALMEAWASWCEPPAKCRAA